jgi:Uma2 family endonuclease
MEVYKSLPEGTLAELINGIIYMSPSPLYKHQKILRSIARQLEDKILDAGLGEVIVAPFDVYLDEELNAVQPDIIVVLKANDKILDRKGHIHGVPDLLIEILSEGNKKHDTFRKKELYEKFGVKEYWIINPVDSQVIVYALDKGRFVEYGKANGVIQSKLLNLEFKF